MYLDRILIKAVQAKIDESNQSKSQTPGDDEPSLDPLMPVLAVVVTPTFVWRLDSCKHCNYSCRSHAVVAVTSASFCLDYC